MSNARCGSGVWKPERPFAPQRREKKGKVLGAEQAPPLRWMSEFVRRGDSRIARIVAEAHSPLAGGRRPPLREMRNEFAEKRQQFGASCAGGRRGPPLRLTIGGCGAPGAGVLRQNRCALRGRFVKRPYGEGKRSPHSPPPPHPPLTRSPFPHRGKVFSVRADAIRPCSTLHSLLLIPNC